MDKEKLIKDFTKAMEALNRAAKLAEDYNLTKEAELITSLIEKLAK